LADSDLLAAFFSPRRIAVIGASEQGLYPAGILKSLLENGFPGELYPVNPRRSTVFDLPAYPEVTCTPHPPDLAIVTIPRQAVIPSLAQCLQVGVKAAVIISAGFAEADGEGRQLQFELERLLAGSVMRVLGPNCAGLADLPGKMIAARLPAPPLPGSVSFVSQSGALMMSFYGLFAARRVGMNRLISLGNQVDLTVSESIASLIEDPRSRVVAVFLEGVSDGHRFIQAARRALELGKPLVMLKSGRTEAGQQSAASHTAALSGSDRVFSAICRQLGVLLVDDLNDLVAVSQIFARFPPPAHDRFNLAVITQSGGLGSLTADLCSRAAIPLPIFGRALRERLHSLPYLLHYGEIGNPADVRGAGLERAATLQTLQPFHDDPDIDALLLLLAKPVSRIADLETASAIVASAARSAKPLLVVWMGQRQFTDADDRLASHILADAGIPVFEQPGDCIRALSHFLQYTRFRRSYLEDMETGRDPAA
jgi:acyl-CoA synthetase (NDP forming)